MTTPDESLDGHDLDEEGDHYEDECWQCLHRLTAETSCRCGKCCHLLIELGWLERDEGK